MERINLNNLFKRIEIKDPTAEVIRQILELILSGVLKIGDELPPIKELQQRLKISNTQMIKAIDFLLSLGIIKTFPNGTIIIINTSKRTQSYLPHKKNYSFIKFNPKGLKESNYSIGFSQYTLDHPARRFMIDKFIEYAEKNFIKTFVKDANWSSKKENEHINELIKMKVDGLIIGTHDCTKLKNTLMEAFKAKIPVIVFASGGFVPDLPFNIWASTDAWQQGRTAGYYLCSILAGRGKIGQIIGDYGSQIAEGRKFGLLSALDDFPGVKLVANTATGWKKTSTIEAVKKMINSHKYINALIAHCDEQAIGAAIAVKELGRNLGKNKIHIFSVSDCQKECFDMIESGEIELTQNYEQNGAVALNLMLQLLEGMNPPKLINLGTSFVIKNNLHEHNPNF